MRPNWETSRDERDSLSASSQSGTACTNKVSFHDVKAAMPLVSMFSSFCSYCITIHCFVGIASFEVSNLRFMLKFFDFFRHLLASF